MFQILSKLFDFSTVNLAPNLIDIIFAVIQALLIAFITKIVLDRALQKEKKIGKRLKDYGVESVKSGDGKMSNPHVNLAFGRRGHPTPSNISLCFITGRGFFQSFQEKTNYLLRALENGCSIRILLADPFCGSFYEGKWKQTIDSCNLEKLRSEDYIHDVAVYYYSLLTHPQEMLLRNAAFVDRTAVMLLYPAVKGCLHDEATCLNLLETHMQKHGDFRWQILHCKKMVDTLSACAKNGGSIALHYYTDEYRTPITLVNVDATKKSEAVTYLWTNMNAGTRETSDSINIFFKVKESESSVFVSDTIDTFEYLWTSYANKPVQ